MIIYEDDARSIRTLVSPSDTHPQSILPPYLAPLSFTFLAVSIPPFLFAVINIPISLTYTIPTIITFAFSIPFHLGAIYIFRNSLDQISTSSYQWPFRKLTKRVLFFYTVTLQLLWLVSAVTCTWVLVDTWGKWKEGCPAHQQCRWSRWLILFLVSTVLMSIMVVLLGVISWILFRWDNSPPSGLNFEPTPSPPATTACNENHPETYYLIPLTYASFGCTLAPFVISLIQIMGPLEKMYSCTIPTILAYTLTTHTHIVTLVGWRNKSYQQTPSSSHSKPLLPVPSRIIIAYLILLQVPWIVSTVMTAQTFLDGGRAPSTNICINLGAILSAASCRTQETIYLAATLVSTLLETIILGVMTAISIRYHLGQRRIRRASLLPPTGQATGLEKRLPRAQV